MKICEIWLKSIFSLIFDLFSFFLFENFVQVLSQRFERHIGHHHFMYSFKKLKTKIDHSDILVELILLCFRNGMVYLICANVSSLLVLPFYFRSPVIWSMNWVLFLILLPMLYIYILTYSVDIVLSNVHY